MWGILIRAGMEIQNFFERKTKKTGGTLIRHPRVDNEKNYERQLM